MKSLSERQQMIIWNAIKRIQRSLTEDELAQSIATFEEEVGAIDKDFVCYFKKEYLCEDWKYSWLDITRKKLGIQREGLGNTTNYLEAIFKKLLTVYLGQKVRLTVS
jgi:hypothetical protein